MVLGFVKGVGGEEENFSQAVDPSEEGVPRGTKESVRERKGCINERGKAGVEREREEKSLVREERERKGDNK
jgi:hypothetical protein